MVFSSTGGAIYGECDGARRPRTSTRAPLSPYGTSKLAGEEYLATWNRLYGERAHRAPLRQRLRAAPGPARRGGRRRDLLRAGSRRARRCTSSATARRQRDYVYVGRRRRRRPWPRSSGRPACSTSARAWPTSVLDLFEVCRRRFRGRGRARLRPAATRRAAAQRPRPGPRGAELGFAAPRRRSTRDSRRPGISFERKERARPRSEIDRPRGSSRRSFRALSSPGAPPRSSRPRSPRSSCSFSSSSASGSSASSSTTRSPRPPTRRRSPRSPSSGG